MARPIAIAQIARARTQIGETELQILNVDQTRQSEAQRELREVEARLAEIAERRIASEDQLRRIELRAPIAGVVHELRRAHGGRRDQLRRAGGADRAEHRERTALSYLVKPFTDQVARAFREK